MTAQILDGRAMAKEVRQEIIAEVAEFKEQYGFVPYHRRRSGRR